MWSLVRSPWILHVSCNKRKGAPMDMHSCLFGDEACIQHRMHLGLSSGCVLSLFLYICVCILTHVIIIKCVCKIPITFLCLTGLWLSNSRIIKHYIKEPKLPPLYGSCMSSAYLIVFSTCQYHRSFSNASCLFYFYY